MNPSPIRSFGLLSRINHGWEPLEPVLLGLLAMEKHLLLLGRHGTGKTQMVRTLARGLGDGSFAFYDATKDDLISIAGIPDADAMAGGSLRFVSHDRAIWNKRTVVVDELTRAAKENQNLWLEILESRSCFGLPIAVRSVVATANPESYAAAFHLDEALLDRFHVVVPVPEQQEGVAPTDVRAMVALALGGTEPPAYEVSDVVARIRSAHDALLREGAVARVTDYLAALVPQLLLMLGRGERRYVSVRTYARNLPETILAVSAALRAAGDADPLPLAASLAVRYAIATKAQLGEAALEQLHRGAVAHFHERGATDATTRRQEFQTLRALPDRIQWVGKHWIDIGGVWTLDEVEKAIGAMANEATGRGQRAQLLPLRQLMDRIGYRGDGRRQVEAHLVMVTRQMMAAAAPTLTALAERHAFGAQGSHASVEDTETAAERAASRILTADAEGALLDSSDPETVDVLQRLVQAWDTGLGLGSIDIVHDLLTGQQEGAHVG